MNLIQKTMGVGAILGVLAMSGNSNKLDKQTIYLAGTVKKEFGTANQVIEPNENCNYIILGDLTYGLQIKTNEGLYTASIVEYKNRPLEALAAAIEQGDKVKFVKKKDGKNRFGIDKIGRIYSDEIIHFDNK